MQSVSILSDDLCPSMLLFPFAAFLLCFPTVLSGYCNASFYFLGILGVMKLHHSEVQVCSNCENTVEKPFNSSRTYHQLSTLKRNIHLSFGRIFKTCLFPGLFNASGTSRKNLSSVNNVNFSSSLYVLSQPIIDSFSRSITYATQFLPGALFL